MKEGTRCLAVAATLLGLTGAMLAAPVPVTLVTADFNTLLGGSASPVGTPLVTDMSLGNLKADVVSQAFTDGAGNYAYLYQVVNKGTVGNNVVEVFTCYPFAGADPNTSTLGYLTANPPTGFTLGQQTPAGASIDKPAGPTISFGFPGWQGIAIDPGESSSTLYVLSDNPPGLITGNVIDGMTGSGDVVGAVPEPASVVLLGLGAVAGVLRRRRIGR